jgi:hypothetical protein
MKIACSIALLATALAAAPAAVHADVLLVDRVQKEAVMPVPPRGITMDQVLARYGEPAERVAPVGGNKPQHPPITRWVYGDFTVYFEHDKVIDTVANRLALEQGPKPAQ